MNEKTVSIGKYLPLKTIGKGGMGEVLLVYDPICKREVALKRIRNDIAKKSSIKKRFLREAKIASQLSHPSIIPIYSIHTDDEYIYYTMPYIEGKLLKDLLEDLKKEEKNEINNSITTLVIKFLSICEAIAYTHSKGILHRDLKPSNIIIGKYGEVLIIDWGIAQEIHSKEKETSEKIKDEDKNVTKPGKVSGTVAFMAPERAFGAPSSPQTDIYALGVMLYQILTLTSPFKRYNLAYFRKYAKKERLIDPIERAPTREIPKKLSQISKKCLSPDISKRYKKVEEIINDLKDYIDGKPEWVLTNILDINRKGDWSFNENIFLPKHTKITQSSEFAQWVNLSLSKVKLSKNSKIEADILLKDSSKGFGFIIASPNKKNMIITKEGYFIWIGINKIKIFRSKALLFEVDTPNLKLNSWHHITITKDERMFYFDLDDQRIINYYNRIPYLGSHFGIVYTDLGFSIKDIKIFSASNTAIVSCLAIPDSFFVKGDFKNAYEEYKKIALSFPGRDEGYRATYRSGISILEMAKLEKKDSLFQQALDEFEKLHNTPAGPLEYVGKSAVYAAMEEFEEETKCLELAVRKFKDHPLSPTVKEFIIYRIFESSIEERTSACRLILLVIQHISSCEKHSDIKTLIENLNKHLEKLYFILPSKKSLAIDLSFRLGKKQNILELLENEEDRESIKNGSFALLELGEINAAEKLIKKGKYPLIEIVIKAHKTSISAALRAFFKSAPKALKTEHIRSLICILRYAIDKKELSHVEKVFHLLKGFKVPKESQEMLCSLNIWALLLKKKIEEAKPIFLKFKKEIKDDKSPLFFLYGILLYLEKGQKTATSHFLKFLETPYPKTPALLSHYLTEKMDKWLKHAFFFEKRELYRQLSLFYMCKKDTKKRAYFERLSMQKF